MVGVPVDNFAGQLPLDFAAAAGLAEVLPEPDPEELDPDELDPEEPDPDVDEPDEPEPDELEDESADFVVDSFAAALPLSPLSPDSDFSAVVAPTAPLRESVR